MHPLVLTTITFKAQTAILAHAFDHEANFLMGIYGHAND